jgi:beta-glucanase (GH16 family)
MKKGNILNLVLVLLIAVSSVQIKSQIPPNEDPNWIKNNTLSNDFSSTVNSSYWHTADGNGWCGGHTSGGIPTCPDYGPETSPSQVTYDGNNIIFTIEQKNSNIPIVTKNDMIGGFIISEGFDYYYGYYEIRALMPGCLINGEPNGRGIQPEFWLYYDEYRWDTISGVRTKYIIVQDEIDIFEPTGEAYDDASTNTVGLHDEDGSGEKLKYPKDAPCNYYGGFTYNSSTPFYDGYHTFAVEFLPDRLIFYFDDEPIRALNNSELIHLPDHDMRVVLGLRADTRTDKTDPDVSDSGIFPAETSLPDSMMVDYFHYYQLNMDNCMSDVTFESDYIFDNYDWGPGKNITIGNGSVTITVNSGEDLTLRPSESVAIYGNFSLPLGSELNIIPTECY